MQKLSYEEAAASLDKIISQLESGNLTMQQALEAFEQGKILAQTCYENLEKVKGKLTEINEVVGKLIEEA